jgi:hypothetical protein
MQGHRGRKVSLVDGPCRPKPFPRAGKVGWSHPTLRSCRDNGDEQLVGVRIRRELLNTAIRLAQVSNAHALTDSLIE